MRSFPKIKFALAALPAAALLRPDSLMACAACYGQSDSPLARAMNWGIFVLLGVVVCVLSGVTLFFVHVSRRTATPRAAEPGRSWNHENLNMQKLLENILGLPVLASENGRGVDDLIIYIHLLMIALFVGWLGYFGYTLWRFRRARNPKADYMGVRNHASNYIEGVVVIVEAVLLIFVAVPLWAKAAQGFPSESKSTVLQIVAQQFNWNVRYPGKDAAFGKQDMHFVTEINLFGIDPDDAKGKDDVQMASAEIHVPVNKPVIAYISSKDVIHSFKVIAMRVTQDAIPGMRIPIWFRPTKEGRYQINCAQLCGNSHSSMSSGFLVVESQEAFEKWLGSRAGGATTLE